MTNANESYDRNSIQGFDFKCIRCGSDHIIFRPGVQTNGIFYVKAKCVYCNVPSGALRTAAPEEFEFKFGKHIGKTINEVYEIDKPYLSWCSENIPDKKLRNCISEYLTKRGPDVD